MRSNLTGETDWSADKRVHLVVAHHLSAISKIEPEFFYALLQENTLLNVDSSVRARFEINLQTELKLLIFNVALLDHKRDPCDWGRYRPPAETHVKASPEPVRSRHPAQAQASQHLVNGKTRAVRSSSHQRSYEEKHEHHQVLDCGKEMQADEKFCHGCGTELEWRYR